MRKTMATWSLLGLATTWVACGCGSNTAGEGRSDHARIARGVGSDGSPTRGDAARALREPSTSSGFCPPLPPPTGRTIRVRPSDAQDLGEVASRARPGDTILFDDGTYRLEGTSMQLETPGVTLRSASGDRERVVLDGGYDTSIPVAVLASDVTIADLTIQRAQHHPIHVAPFPNRTIRNTVIYNVVIRDPGQQGIKVNQHEEGFPEEGVIACSRIELTDAGRPHVWMLNDECYTGGIDIHRARGWVIRDNSIEGFWCERELSEHGIHVWDGCRDTVVERNVIVDCARGIGFGMWSDGRGRRYPDDPCPGVSDPDHFGGVIRNNFVFAARPELFSSESGFDNGISLWAACDARVHHNTILSLRQPFASIEWRFPGSQGVEIVNNLVSHNLLARDGAGGTSRGNVEGASAALFVDGRRGDLHIRASATDAIDRGDPAPPGCERDIDGDERGAPPDVGADERRR